MKQYLAQQVFAMYHWEELAPAHRENFWDKPSLLTGSFMATQWFELKFAQINSTGFQTRLTEHTNPGFKALHWKTDPQATLPSAPGQQTNDYTTKHWAKLH